uniref:Calponin-homology (CH) domain-containing protein n=1 Tax=Mastacembelus armatus TaxID=205130 RepID=A0A3Q3KKH0_9TELE
MKNIPQTLSYLSLPYYCIQETLYKFIYLSISVFLTVEHEQIQKRTFTNWINFQLAKRSPPSFVSDLFSDIRDGPQLLDLLEVMSGQLRSWPALCPSVLVIPPLIL